MMPRKGKGSISPVKITLFGCAMEYIVKWQMSELQWVRGNFNSLLRNPLLATCKNGFLREGSSMGSCWGTGERREVPKEHTRYKKGKLLIYTYAKRGRQMLFFIWI